MTKKQLAVAGFVYSIFWACLFMALLLNGVNIKDIVAAFFGVNALLILGSLLDYLEKYHRVADEESDEEK